MRTLFRTAIALCFLFFVCGAAAQNNTNVIGVWKGLMTDALSSFNYTIHITDVTNGEVTGTAMAGNQSQYCETHIKGTYANGRLTLYESGIIRTNYRNRDAVCLLGMVITVNTKSLTGSYRPISNVSECLPGTIHLSLEEKEKVEAPVKPVVPAVPEAKPIQKERKLSLIKELIIDAAEAEIQVFDNGIIDGDSITLTDNSKEIFARALLSTKALKHSINNKETNIHTITFFAGNLGTIPPNTGIMVVTANRQRWEINFSSDFAQTSYVKIILNNPGK